LQSVKKCLPLTVAATTLLTSSAVVEPAVSREAEAIRPAAAASADKVGRGKSLVTVAGCNDCHTPWKVGAAGPSPT
jgi:mono/diheme cytochrome c family protein